MFSCVISVPACPATIAVAPVSQLAARPNCPTHRPKRHYRRAASLQTRCMCPRVTVSCTTAHFRSTGNQTELQRRQTALSQGQWPRVRVERASCRVCVGKNPSASVLLPGPAYLCMPPLPYSSRGTQTRQRKSKAAQPRSVQAQAQAGTATPSTAAPRARADDRGPHDGPTDALPRPSGRPAQVTARTHLVLLRPWTTLNGRTRRQRPPVPAVRARRVVIAVSDGSASWGLSHECKGKPAGECPKTGPAPSEER